MHKIQFGSSFNKYDILELYFGTFHFGISIVLLLLEKKIKHELPSNHWLQKSAIAWKLERSQGNDIL